jgi:C-methyltransferase
VPAGPFPDEYGVQNAAAMLSVAMWTSRMVQTAIELGIPDAMPEDGGASVPTLADLTGTRPDLLARLLRALSAHGVFALAEDGRYVHTEVSLVLRNDHPHTLHHYAKIFANQWLWKACAAMTDVVRTGRDPILAEFGRPMWAYLASEPAEALAFQQGMTDFARLFAPSLAAALDLRDARTVVDVGGGQGILLGAVLDRHPGIDGVLFENETVLGSLRGEPLTAQFIDRFRLVAGNALKAVDCPADIYLLSNFLHLFEDDDAVRMLTNCAAAAPPGARIIAMERLIADGPQDTFKTMLDLMMLCLNHGLERTEEEYHTLFERAGLDWVGITATTGDVSLIEGVVRPTS